MGIYINLALLSCAAFFFPDVTVYRAGHPDTSRMQEWVGCAGRAHPHLALCTLYNSLEGFSFRIDKHCWEPSPASTLKRKYCPNIFVGKVKSAALFSSLSRGRGHPSVKLWHPGPIWVFGSCCWRPQWYWVLWMELGLGTSGVLAADPEESWAIAKIPFAWLSIQQRKTNNTGSRPPPVPLAGARSLWWTPTNLAPKETRTTSLTGAVLAAVRTMARTGASRSPPTTAVHPDTSASARGTCATTGSCLGLQCL